MLGVIGAALLITGVVVACWPDRLRIAKQSAELVGGAAFVCALVLIGVGLSPYVL